jgi:hypothetical protein
MGADSLTGSFALFSAESGLSTNGPKSAGQQRALISVIRPLKELLRKRTFYRSAWMIAFGM